MNSTWETGTSNTLGRYLHGNGGNIFLAGISDMKRIISSAPGEFEK